MVLQIDQPATTGFLCHICVWRGRAESQELMDLEALVGHGQRHHYLQPEQISDHLEAAFFVKRDPKLLDRSKNVHCERGYERFKAVEGLEASRFRGVRLVERASLNVPSQIKLNNSTQRSIQDSKTATSFDLDGLDDLQYSDFPANLKLPEAYTPQQAHSTYPILESADLDASGDKMPDHSALSLTSFAGSKSDGRDASLPTEERIFSTANGDPSDVDAFDYELACLPYFDTQLHEYMESYGMSNEGVYLGRSLDEAATTQRWKRDRLHIWPEMVVREAETLETCVKIEAEDEDIWMSMPRSESGEAEEYMDMRDMESYIW